MKDRSAVTLIGPTPTVQQVINGQLATCLYHCNAHLEKLDDEYSESLMAIIRPSTKVSFVCCEDDHELTCSAKKINRAFNQVVDPLLSAIRRELGAIIAKLHRIDFSDNADPTTSMGGGASPYIKDLSEKLNYVKSEVLPLFNITQVTQDWWVSRYAQLHSNVLKISRP